MRLSLQEVVEATAGRSRQAGDIEFASYHTDSREVLPGGLFFALRGAAMDGHAFVDAAAQRGAAGVVVDRPTQAMEGLAVIEVEDTWEALYRLARAVKARVAPLTVGVTGSNGKTSTREFLAAALGVRGPVLRTRGNLNTETGVPLTMLELEAEHRSLVLEMGMQGPGEIARLAALAEPSIGVITGIGTVHLEFFPSQEHLARAKGELVAALPAGGVAVLPTGPYLDLLRGLTAARVLTFGPGGDLEPSGYETTSDGCRFSAGGSEVRLGQGGRHMMLNACAALAAAEAAGVPIAQAAGALAAVRVGRRLEELAAPGGLTVVDDSYNASPESMLAAFDAVAERPRAGRLLAVLGEMRELGVAAAAAHADVGRRAAETFDAACVVDVGWGRRLAESAGADLVAGPDAAVAWVRERARTGDVVLVKASHGLHLEAVVSALVANA